MFALFMMSLVVCFASVVGSYWLEGCDFGSDSEAGAVHGTVPVGLGELW